MTKNPFLMAGFLSIFLLGASQVEGKAPSAGSNYKNFSSSGQALSRSKPIIKLYPQMRRESEASLTAFPIHLVEAFMHSVAVADEITLEKAPRILGNEKNTYFYSLGDRIYVEGVAPPGRYLIYRINQDIIDPETGRLLGKEIVYSGEAKTIEPRDETKVLIRDAKSREFLPKDKRYNGTMWFGSKAPNFAKFPAERAKPMVITNLTSEVRAGDRLLKVPETSNARFDFTVHAAPSGLRARVVHVFEGLAGQHIGKYQSILFNKGKEDGVERGALVYLYEKVPYHALGNTENSRKLALRNWVYPVHLIGKALVYSNSKHLAYALVLENYDGSYLKAGDLVLDSQQRDLEDVPEYEPRG
ncbi:MAG: hypothetical protein WDW20_05070 [Neisseriaceae bacterium]